MGAGVGFVMTTGVGRELACSGNTMGKREIKISRFCQERGSLSSLSCSIMLDLQTSRRRVSGSKLDSDGSYYIPIQYPPQSSTLSSICVSSLYLPRTQTSTQARIFRFRTSFISLGYNIVSKSLHRRRNDRHLLRVWNLLIKRYVPAPRSKAIGYRSYCTVRKHV